MHSYCPPTGLRWAADRRGELTLEQTRHELPWAIGGPSASALIILWGSTLVLYGLAVKKEGYSVRLGWTGVVLGATIFVLGTVQYLEPNNFPGLCSTAGAHWPRSYGPSHWGLPCGVERVPRQTHATRTEMSK